MTDHMKLGLYGFQSVEPDILTRRARLAEEAGFESLWIGDHIALSADLGGDQARLEAVVALSYLAAAAAPAATSAVEDLIMSAAATLIGRI